MYIETKWYRFAKDSSAKGKNLLLIDTLEALHPPPPKVDGTTQAQIITSGGSDLPQGRAYWSIKLLTSELQQGQIVTEISRETVRCTLKKTIMALENSEVLYPRKRFGKICISNGSNLRPLL